MTGDAGNWTHDAKEGNDEGGEWYWPLGQRVLSRHSRVLRALPVVITKMLKRKVLRN